MEFLMNNYIWILICIVVVIMTIIGYYAEKTDFGKKVVEKPKKEKKVKEKKNKKEKENDFFEENVIDEIINEEPQVNNVEENSTNNESEVLFDEANDESFETPVDSSAELFNEVEEPVENFDDLNAAMPEFKGYEEPTVVEDASTPVEEVVEPAEETAEVLNEPVSEVVEEPTIPEVTPYVESLESDEKEEPSLPEIETLNTSDTTEEDDVWNF